MEILATQFQTMEEVNEYLSGNTITCLLCGKEKVRLNCHLQRAHNITPDEYRLRFGIPLKQSLATEASRAKSSAAMQRPGRMEQFNSVRRILKPGGMRGKQPRGRVPAVANEWRKNLKTGQYFARKLVIIPCAVCKCDVATTALSATQPVRCMKCTTPAARSARQLYWKEKWAA